MAYGIYLSSWVLDKCFGMCKGPDWPQNGWMNTVLIGGDTRFHMCVGADTHKLLKTVLQFNLLQGEGANMTIIFNESVMVELSCVCLHMCVCERIKEMKSGRWESETALFLDECYSVIQKGWSVIKSAHQHTNIHTGTDTQTYNKHTHTRISTVSPDHKSFECFIEIPIFRYMTISSSSSLSLYSTVSWLFILFPVKYIMK